MPGAELSKSSRLDLEKVLTSFLDRNCRSEALTEPRSIILHTMDSNDDAYTHGLE